MRAACEPGEGGVAYPMACLATVDNEMSKSRSVRVKRSSRFQTSCESWAPDGGRDEREYEI